MNTKHREKFISLLKDSVLTLCKNGLMDDHGITRVEGLLGITLQNKEVFLINIKEELLSPVVLSYRSERTEPSADKKTPTESPIKFLATSSDNQSLPFRHREFNTPARGSRRSRDSTTQEDVIFVEVESDVDDEYCSDDMDDSFRKEVSRSCIVENKARVDGNQLHEESNNMTIESGDTDVAGAVGISEPLELLRRTKDEPNDLVFNVSGAQINPLQNFDISFNCQKAVTDGNLGALWPKDPKDIRLSASIVPCGYLPPMLSYSGRSRLNCSSPSASSMPFPNLLPTFYNGAGSSHALSLSQQRNLKPTGRQMKKYCCDICNYKSNRSYNLLRHVMHVHAIGSSPCADCGIMFHHRMQLRAHRIEVHGDIGMGNSLTTGNSISTVKQEPEEAVNS